MKIFDGWYGRTGHVYIENKRECVVCGKEDTCLVADASEGEYKESVICKECVTDLFARGQTDIPGELI